MGPVFTVPAITTNVPLTLQHCECVSYNPENFTLPGGDGERNRREVRGIQSLVTTWGVLIHRGAACLVISPTAAPHLVSVNAHAGK